VVKFTAKRSPRTPRGKHVAGAAPSCVQWRACKAHAVCSTRETACRATGGVRAPNCVLCAIGMYTAARAVFTARRRCLRHVATCRRRRPRPTAAGGEGSQPLPGPKTPLTQPARAATKIRHTGDRFTVERPRGAGADRGSRQRSLRRSSLATGESLCKSPLNVHRDTYDHSCY
jgi:hypothetical protein